MRAIARTITAIVAVVVLVLLVGVALRQMDNPSSYQGCARYDKAIASLKSERTMSARAAARDALDTQIADIQRQQAQDKACAASAPTPSASASTPAPKGAWKPHYYFFDSGKESPQTFGPAVNPGTAAKEFRKRLTVDPSLACGDGGLILADKDGGITCVQALLKSVKARDTFIGLVFKNIKTMSVKTVGASTVPGVFMVDVNGIPRIISDPRVPYTAPYKVLVVVTNDGRTLSFRLECGFQWVGLQPIHGTPYTPAPPCVNGNVRSAQGSCGNTPPSAPPTKPTTTTTTTTTTTATTPPPTAPTTTTTLAPKDPRKDINVNPSIPVGERVAPTQSADPGQAQPTQPSPPPPTTTTTRSSVPPNEGGTPTSQPVNP